MQLKMNQSVLRLVIILIVLEMTSSEETCLSDCQEKSNAESIFEQVCCLTPHIGKKIKLAEGKERSYLFCPDKLPRFCDLVNVSCLAILNLHPSALSGYYIITPNYESVEAVYCDMEGDNCGGEGGWTRIANINMTISGTSCPEGLAQLPFSNAVSDLCGKTLTEYASCNSSILHTFGFNFTKVCGRIRGYQFGTTLAFSLGSNDIESHYLSGVSITHGDPRKHIWSYVSGWFYYCPCNLNSINPNVPGFVGSDYYCETAVFSDTPTNTVYYNDPLWDGRQCNSNEHSDETPCCLNSSLPWFVQDLNENITENIELRICNTWNSANILLDLIELYVY